MNYLMAKHFIQAKHGSDSNLKELMFIGIEHMTLNIRGGDRWLKQHETYWIHKLVCKVCKKIYTSV